jgi:hypothetical protein
MAPLDLPRHAFTAASCPSCQVNGPRGRHGIWFLFSFSSLLLSPLAPFLSCVQVVSAASPSKNRASRPLISFWPYSFLSHSTLQPIHYWLWAGTTFLSLMLRLITLSWCFGLERRTFEILSCLRLHSSSRHYIRRAPFNTILVFQMGRCSAVDPLDAFVTLRPCS